MNNKFVKVLVFCFVFFLNSELAFADVGIPIIVYSLFEMLLAFIPVVLIEAMTYKKSFNVKFKNALGASFVANLFSTIIGIPLAWILQLILQIATTGLSVFGLVNYSNKIVNIVLLSAWLPPYSGRQASLMVNSAVVVGLIPAFFISILLEQWVLRKFFNSINPDQLRKAVWSANIRSYVFLVIWPVLGLLLLIVGK